ncbi:tRNA (adenosine(37)-N6)-threonylcarbamoyltransferase complex ATPase subunit type 1 TsaE [Rhodovibrionaceae bacterium A322]
MTGPSLHISLPDEDATRQLARHLAPLLRAGDVLALDGDLGAGKTAFSRALINALPGPAEEVPSPTFTLVQTYERADLEVWHVDLYRLEEPEEAIELGLEEAFSDALCLVEWPERLGPYLPPTALSLVLTHGSQDSPATQQARTARLSGGSNWTLRLDALLKDLTDSGSLRLLTPSSPDLSSESSS